jgi:hypothetical protein
MKHFGSGPLSYYLPSDPRRRARLRPGVDGPDSPGRLAAGQQIQFQIPSAAELLSAIVQQASAHGPETERKSRRGIGPFIAGSSQWRRDEIIYVGETESASLGSQQQFGIERSERKHDDGHRAAIDKGRRFAGFAPRDGSP